MKTCRTCQWADPPEGSSFQYPPALWMCNCPRFAKPLLSVDPVTGRGLYSDDVGTKALEKRPRCQDTNTDGTCSGWEENPDRSGFWQEPVLCLEPDPARTTKPLVLPSGPSMSLLFPLAALSIIVVGVILAFCIKH